MVAKYLFYTIPRNRAGAHVGFGTSATSVEKEEILNQSEDPKSVHEDLQSGRLFGRRTDDWGGS